MRQILFVDDDEKILSGLRRLLRPRRQEWAMRFASSGDEALALLARESAQVVVSDMRMPGMDGAALLTEVQRLYPGTVRIVLSGHADDASVLKALRCTHQYLSKPCDPDELRGTIERACALREILHSERLTKVVGSLDALPSVPEVSLELDRALASPDVEVGDVSEIIERDPAIAARILQLVNSAFFGLPRRIVDVREAVGFLGLETVHVLAMGAAAFATLEDRSPLGFDLEELYQHCFEVGSRARDVARVVSRDREAARDAFAGGLLHDIGKVILACGDPAGWREAQALVSEKGFAPAEAELWALGATHAEVGAYLLGLWGLPQTLVEAVAYHHTPDAAEAWTPFTALAIYIAEDWVKEGAEGRPGRLGAEVEALLRKAGFGDKVEALRAYLETHDAGRPA